MTNRSFVRVRVWLPITAKIFYWIPHHALACCPLLPSVCLQELHPICDVYVCLFKKKDEKSSSIEPAASTSTVMHCRRLALCKYSSTFLAQKLLLLKREEKKTHLVFSLQAGRHIQYQEEHQPIIIVGRKEKRAYIYPIQCNISANAICVDGACFRFETPASENVRAS